MGGLYGENYLWGEQLVKNSNVDIVAKREGELTLSSIVNAFENNKSYEHIPGILLHRNNEIIDTGNPDLINDINSLNFPDYDDFSISNYVINEVPFKDPLIISKRLAVNFSRGCKGKCDFCLWRKLWCDNYRHRSSESMINEIKFMKNRYNIHFYEFNDNLMNGNMAEVNKMLDLMISEKINIKWTGHMRIDKKIDSDFAKKLKLSGCANITFGLESGSDHVLKSMKRPYNAETAINVLKVLFENDIYISSNIIVGHPSETREHFYETMNFLKSASKYLSQPPSPAMCLFFRGSDMFNNYKNNSDFTFYHPLDWKYKDNDLEERKTRVKLLNDCCEKLFNKVLKMTDKGTL